eukprot:2060172-Amphidinium_carterae.1
MNKKDITWCSAKVFEYVTTIFRKKTSNHMNTPHQEMGRKQPETKTAQAIPTQARCQTCDKQRSHRVDWRCLQDPCHTTWWTLATTTFKKTCSARKTYPTPRPAVAKGHWTMLVTLQDSSSGNMQHLPHVHTASLGLSMCADRSDDNNYTLATQHARHDASE